MIVNLQLLALVDKHLPHGPYRRPCIDPISLCPCNEVDVGVNNQQSWCSAHDKWDTFKHDQPISNQTVTTKHVWPPSSIVKKAIMRTMLSPNLHQPQMAIFVAHSHVSTKKTWGKGHQYPVTFNCNSFELSSIKSRSTSNHSHLFRVFCFCFSCGIKNIASQFDFWFVGMKGLTLAMAFGKPICYDLRGIATTAAATSQQQCTPKLWYRYWWTSP